MNYQLPFILFFGFFISIESMAQERVEKTGVLLNFKLPIHGAHILNLSSNEGTSSLKDGTFKIRVRLNDTLVISHLNYRKKTFIYTKLHQKNEQLIIYLDVVTNKLDTVEIKSHDLSGMLNTDSEKAGRVVNRDSIVQMYQDLASQRSTKNFGRDLERPPLNIVDPTGGPGVGASVGISFRFKDLELKRELSAKKSFPNKLITDFGLTYFTETLNIPEEKIYHFISYCEFKNIRRLYNRNKIIRVIEILEKESINYLKIKD